MADTLNQPMELHPVRRDGPRWDRDRLKEVVTDKAPALVLRLPGGVPLEFFLSAFWMLPVLTLACAVLIDRPLLGVALGAYLFLAILLHEFGHAIAAWATGNRVLSVQMWGFSGLCLAQPIERRRSAILFIAAGPLVNLVLCLMSLAGIAALMVFGDPIKAMWPQMLFNVVDGLELFAIMNAIFFVYNLIPIVPLDGGQILRLILTAIMRDNLALRLTAMVSVLALLSIPVAMYLAYDNWGVLLPIIPPPLKTTWHMLRHGEVPIPPQPVRVSTLT
ncbi:MAG: site-2 protease family protein [Pseudomonadota bacterium]